MKHLSRISRIPYEAFKKYVAQDSIKRYVCGNSVGQAPLVKRKDQYFLAGLLARKDQSNAGEIKSEAIDLVLGLDPFITRGQAR